MSSSSKSHKEKDPISKLIATSDSETEPEHELSFYVEDRIKLMKEVLKIIKPKKIKSMAPDCIKHLDIEEINSLLLEELLGISNKRLKYIFNGQNLGEDSSSTDPEEDKQAVDIISLDDVTDDDLIIEFDSTKPKKSKKTGTLTKKVKKEKPDKSRPKETSEKLQEDKLMSVLELLELQARARAIRSQLLLEANKKNEQRTSESAPATQIVDDGDSDTDAVIIESPKNEEIVITSSDSEDEVVVNNTEGGKKKITLIRDRLSTKSNEENVINENMVDNGAKSDSQQPDQPDSAANYKEQENSNKIDEKVTQNDNTDNIVEDDCDVLIVDQEEINNIADEMSSSTQNKENT